MGFADLVPEYAAIKDGTAAQPTLPATAPAIVVFGYAFGGQAGDSMRLTIVGPDGAFIDDTVTLDRDQAQFFRAAGKRLKAAAWPTGTYQGTASLLRGDEVINSAEAELQVK